MCVCVRAQRDKHDGERKRSRFEPAGMEERRTATDMLRVGPPWSTGKGVARMGANPSQDGDVPSSTAGDHVWRLVLGIPNRDQPTLLIDMLPAEPADIARLQTGHTRRIALGGTRWTLVAIPEPAPDTCQRYLIVSTEPAKPDLTEFLWALLRSSVGPCPSAPPEPLLGPPASPPLPTCPDDLRVQLQRVLPVTDDVLAGILREWLEWYDRHHFAVAVRHQPRLRGVCASLASAHVLHFLQEVGGGTLLVPDEAAPGGTEGPIDRAIVRQMVFHPRRDVRGEVLRRTWLDSYVNVDSVVLHGQGGQPRLMGSMTGILRWPRKDEQKGVRGGGLFHDQTAQSLAVYDMDVAMVEGGSRFIPGGLRRLVLDGVRLYAEIKWKWQRDGDLIGKLWWRMLVLKFDDGATLVMHLRRTEEGTYPTRPYQHLASALMYAPKTRPQGKGVPTPLNLFLGPLEHCGDFNPVDGPAVIVKDAPPWPWTVVLRLGPTASSELQKHLAEEGIRWPFGGVTFGLSGLELVPDAFLEAAAATSLADLLRTLNTSRVTLRLVKQTRHDLYTPDNFATLLRALFPIVENILVLDDQHDDTLAKLSEAMDQVEATTPASIEYVMTPIAGTGPPSVHDRIRVKPRRRLTPVRDADDWQVRARDVCR